MWVRSAYSEVLNLRRYQAREMAAFGLAFDQEAWAQLGSRINCLETKMRPTEGEGVCAGSRNWPSDRSSLKCKMPSNVA